jgi:outer membrane protein assembly factor BamB
MSEFAAQFTREVARLDVGEPLRTDTPLSVYTAQLSAASNEQVPNQADSQTVRLVTPAPDLTDEEYDTAVDGLTTWRTLSENPTVTTVQASGETPQPWLAVESQGTLLSEVAPLSVDQTRDVLTDIAEALRNAEMADSPIEPGNVRVLPAGARTAATLDWPVGHVRSESPYSQPAASEDDTGLVYGLGGLAYYALTGSLPVSEDTTTLQPSSHNDDVPPAFDAVVGQARHPDPDQRYETPYAFKRAVLFESTATPEVERSTSREETQSGAREETATEESPDPLPDDHRGPARDDLQVEDGTESQSTRLSRRAVLGTASVGVAATALGGTWLATSQVLGPGEETEFPTFQYDAANTGYVSRGTGPTESVTEAWRVSTGERISASPVVGDDIVCITDTSGQLYALGRQEGTEYWTETVDNTIPLSGTVGDDSLYFANWGSDPPSISARTVVDGTPLWDSPIDDTDELVRTISIVDGQLYTVSNSGIRARDVETGNRMWTAETVSVSSLTAAFDDDTLYFGGISEQDGRDESLEQPGVVAVDVTEQRVEWTFPVGSIVTSSPATVDETVYVGSENNSVYAIDAADGTEQWSFEADGRVTSSPAVTDHLGGTLYIGSNDGTIYALDTTDGTVRWTFDTDGIVISSPAVASDTVYVGSQDGTVYALRTDSGKPRWTFDADGSMISSPAVVSNRVYIGTENGTIHALTE